MVFFLSREYDFWHPFRIEPYRAGNITSCSGEGAMSKTSLSLEYRGYGETQNIPVIFLVSLLLIGRELTDNQIPA